MGKPELGQIVGGKYRLLRELGRGGMATVFEAENTLTLKHAAVKWLHPQFHDERQGMQRVIREARASSRVRHENVVDVYDVIVDEGSSSVYLVMELLQGELLSAFLERESLHMHDLVALLVPVMRGVAAAHAASVIHRDIKPDNIFLVHDRGYERPRPKVIDFGISKLAEPEAANATRSGVTMGTPRYVSYEQLLGARNVDVRTDVYAFGVILYEALTGRAPYGHAVTFGEQAVRFVTQVPLSPRTLRPEVPGALDTLVMRALARDREERTATMEDLVLALAPFADPGQFPEPLLVRTGRFFVANGTQATVPDADVDRHAAEEAAPPLRDSDPTIRPSGGALLKQSRRRGALLTALGCAAMAIAAASMPGKEPAASTSPVARPGTPALGHAAVEAATAVVAAIHAPTAAQPHGSADAAAARFDAAPTTAPDERPAPSSSEHADGPRRALAAAHDSPARPVKSSGLAHLKSAAGPASSSRASSALSAPEQPAEGSQEPLLLDDSRHRAGRLRREEF